MTECLGIDQRRGKKVLLLCVLLNQESTDDPENKSGGKVGQKLDDDEDRKNPAYIPRKGLFFEHDVRGHAQEEERYDESFFKCLATLENGDGLPFFPC